MKKQQTKHLQLILILCYLLGTGIQAFGSECTSDTDCGSGEYCEIYGEEVATCSIDSEGNEVCDEIDEQEVLGFCEERPIECTENSDCPSYLICARQGNVTVASDADDSNHDEDIPPEGVEESSDREARPASDELSAPEMTDPGDQPDGPGMCIFVPAECETDNDCAMHFHCEIYEVGVSCGAVPEYDCPEGEDCPEIEPVDCGDVDSSTGLCLPDEIECDSDNACPSDWRCQEIVESSCSGIEVAPIEEMADSSDSDSSDSDSSSEGAPEMTETEPQAQRLVEDMCEETTRSLCVPRGLGAGHSSVATGSGIAEDRTTNNQGGENGGALNTEEETDDENSSDASNNADVEEGGCQAHSTHPASLLAWMLLLLGSFFNLRRRMA